MKSLTPYQACYIDAHTDGTYTIEIFAETLAKAVEAAKTLAQCYHNLTFKSIN